MTDSELPDATEGRGADSRAERLRWIKWWVEYIKSNPVEVWGPQQNALINSQLESARASGMDAEQNRRIREAGRDWQDDTS